MSDRPRYLITLDVTPLDDPTDAAGWRRLKRFLKAILRQYRLKCEGVEIIAPSVEPSPPKKPS